MASENVAAASPGHDTDPVRLASGGAWYGAAATGYDPNGHRAARPTVARDRPRVVSSPAQDRQS